MEGMMLEEITFIDVNFSSGVLIPPKLLVKEEKEEDDDDMAFDCDIQRDSAPSEKRVRADSGLSETPNTILKSI